MAGPSGIGKTTLAKILSEDLNIPFLSGSYSELVPSTKDVKHEDMIKKNTQDILQEDIDLFRKRRDIFNNTIEFISDRSFVDNIAYHINKLSYQIDESDITIFIDACIQSLNTIPTHLIFIPYRADMVDSFKIEDNHKRIINPWYQIQISSLMTTIITQLLNKTFMTKDNYKSMVSKEDGLKVLVLLTTNLEERVNITKQFLTDEY